MYSGKHAVGKPTSQVAKPRKTGYMRVFILWSLLLTLILGTVGFVYAKIFENRIHDIGAQAAPDGGFFDKQASEAGGPVTFLILGSDQRATENDPGRSDTAMLFRMNPKEKTAYLLSVPRDSWVKIPGHGKRKINAAYQLGGPDLMAETMQDLTGFDIDHFVAIDFKGFKEIVDALGGIDIDVEKRIRDRFEGRDIEFDPGMQHMDGAHALDYVRVRHVDDDFGRIGRQQQFLRAVMDKLNTFSGVFKVPKLVDILSRHVTTDSELGIAQMISYGNAVRSIGKKNIQMATLPGEPGTIGEASVVVLDKDKMAWMIERIHNDLPFELTEEEKKNENIHVRVQNGTGRTGVAKKMARRLEDHSFKIREVGNARSFKHYETLIIAPEGMEELAERVQFELGFGRVTSSQKIGGSTSVTSGTEQPSSATDVIVIVGRDFADALPLDTEDDVTVD